MKTNLFTNSHNNGYSVAIIVWLMCIFGNTNVQSQRFSVALATAKETNVMGEAVALTAVVSYNANVPLVVNDPLDNGDYKTRIEIANQESAHFRRYITSEEANDALKDRTKLPLMRWDPNSKATSNVIVFCWRLDDVETNILVFPKPGRYFIRYTVALGSESFSDTATVTFVESRNDEDQKAWEWLQKQDKAVLQEYGGLDHLLAEAGPRTMVLGHLAELMTHYPESVQAKYVQTQITNAENEMRLANAKANAPMSIFEQKVKALESEWYDVKGFLRDTNSPQRLEFARGEIGLSMQKFDGKISEAQFDQQDAALLKSYIEKYCKPLSPDEWKRRNDAYAKEDAERREREMTEMRSHAAENELIFRAARSNGVPK
jgi:hypothetical protein